MLRVIRLGILFAFIVIAGAIAARLDNTTITIIVSVFIGITIGILFAVPSTLLFIHLMRDYANIDRIIPSRPTHPATPPTLGPLDDADEPPYNDPPRLDSPAARRTRRIGIS
jgi:hypothetical protein